MVTGFLLLFLKNRFAVVAKKEALLFVLLAFICGPASAERLSLMTDWSAYGAHGPLFLAQQQGWFKDAGLDVVILDGKGSNSTIQLVASSVADVGFVQLASMATAIGQGMPLISIAGYIRAGDNGVAVPIDGPIKTAHDLAGKKLAYVLGGGSATLLDAFFKRAGIARSDVTLIGVDSSALPSTYVSGHADGAISTVAYMIPLFAETRPSVAISFASVGLVVPSFGLAVRTDEVSSRKADFAKLVPILDRAWTYVADGHVPEAIDAIVASRPGEKLDRTVMTNQLTDYLKLLDTPATQGHPNGWQAESDWQSAIAVLQGTGALKGEHKTGEFFTNQFIGP